MTLGQHLLELRKRLFFAAAGILIGALAGWFLSGFVWDALREPIYAIVHAQHRNAQINYPDITSAFDLKLKISLYVGLVVSSPVWLYQVFAFLMPGLTRTEKRYTFGFFFTAVPLFLAGCAAGWYVLPHVVELMTGFAPTQDAAFINAQNYFDFVLKLVVAIGVAFVLPVFLVLLNFAGVISAHSIIKSWRIACLIIILFTAIATPAADVVSMFLLAIPMVLLYFAAYGIASLHDRRLAKRTRDAEAGMTA
ncbi:MULTISPECIES: twin-arginine translocase subunit TatC [unclassified Cryobacterium]|uniref:twin-arginine translocase subunit TatC n=1 Tax=unclassified Cryobacterium TaxID=2649013 RepID=UPI002AB4C873|nr:MULTISPECIES: twin-arginine translocase subunit TatC [Cryobacterium]MDY7526382.1 twin-arginine translocase subunit TatC [Cryobacterium sp. 10C2]MDY7557813.1 twin-arginine translocase subunit TatC [Cryobacterium sp. 10C3]MEB0004684.1 twin-arginine translocase subunit TatC [Cryobacterium sp. RTC2.1]MEB0203436.1 twin-arginine translocase subunit TatC [Cryobacterium sp. 5I3]MEB0287748.1 twin-arginine translocase subunit TatC [Cryobacterium sp. 10S3]